MAAYDSLSAAIESMSSVLGELSRSGISTSKHQAILQTFQRSITSLKVSIWDLKYRYERPSKWTKSFRKLIEFLYDAEDLLDELKYPLSPFSFFPRKSNTIKRLREELHQFEYDIDIERPGIWPRQDYGHLYASSRGPKTWSYVSREDSSNFVIGRKADLDYVKNMLMPASNSSIHTYQVHLSAVCIVGPGGLGKTTLAQLVYNDPQIQTHFDLRFWARVGQDFDIKVILSSILMGDLEETVNELELNKLQEQLSDKIHRKRILLVLDDFWCDDMDQWDQLRNLLAMSERGSQILVTCRSLADKTLPLFSNMYFLDGLSKEDSLNLFNRFASSPDQEPDADLVRIGRKITHNRCNNIPLDIKLLGGLFYGVDKGKWDQIYSVAQYIPFREQVPPYKLSYDILPPELKMCYAFCSIFPKGYVMKKDVLINMWLALGYLAPGFEAHSMEEIGEHYCSTLFTRGFFQDIKQDEYGNVISFKIHDLLHDLALEVAGYKSLYLAGVGRRNLDMNNVHHLFISNEADSIEIFDHYAASNSLRTILNFKKYALGSFGRVAGMLSKCKRLRLLDLHGVAMETLPDTFDNVPHLRYLDLSDNEELKLLPESITKLSFLQILSLRGCTSLQELPKDMGRLVMLRTLDIDGCNELASIPAGMDNLACLHMLTIGSDNYELDYFGELINMEDLVNRKGKILIKDSTRGEEAFIVKDAHLKVLQIICTDRSSDQNDVYHTFLGIQLYLGTNLITITLSHSCGLQHLTTLSQLRHLKDLRLLKLWNVESIEGDAASELTLRAKKSMLFFPSLEKLVLERMPKLKGWWRDSTWMEMGAIGGCSVNGNAGNTEQLILPTFPRLLDLRIRLCQSMTYFPPCPHVKQLDLGGVSQVFCIKESAPKHPVASGSSGDQNIGLEKLILCYNARVFDSLFEKSVVRSAVDIELKYFHEEESLQVAREGFERCSSSLKYLSIHGLYKLKSLSGGGLEHLTNLQSLTIKDCFELDLEEVEVEEDKGIPWKFLQSMSTLKLDDIPKLVNLPNGFQYLTALQSLHIKSCSNLEALGECVSFLASLKSLHIEDCNSLKTLPECLVSMTSLQILDIKNCPKLQLAASTTTHILEC